MRKLPITPSNDLMRSRIIDPIMANCPENGISPAQFIEDILCLKTRIISRYWTLEPFTMPGLLCENGCIPVQCSADLKHVGKRVKLYVRIDTTMPNVYRVETPRHVFQLDRREWDSIQGHMRLFKGEEPIC